MAEDDNVLIRNMTEEDNAPRGSMTEKDDALRTELKVRNIVVNNVLLFTSYLINMYPFTLKCHKEGALWFQDDLRKEMTETKNGLSAELKVGHIVVDNVLLFT